MIFQRLLRLYPRTWRERYGAELLALLEDTAPTGLARWAAALDMARGAADAHWQSGRQVLRTGGLTGLAVGLLFSASVVLTRVSHRDGTDNGLVVLAGYCAIAALFAAVGAHATRREPGAGSAGLAGAATAWVMVTVMVTTFLVVVPALAPSAGDPPILARPVIAAFCIGIGTATGALLGRLGGRAYGRWHRRQTSVPQ